MRARNKLGLSYAVKAEVPVELADKFLCALANVPHYDHSPDGPNAIRTNGAAFTYPRRRVSTMLGTGSTIFFPTCFPSMATRSTKDHAMA